ncbi:hypothetical protein [Chryseobacterium profundimaris]|uniref:DUF4369 domain-containing protein n=1 Tax=Chryseobacterium profundimaris TaxID=1387275 RepID=A0ABY1NT34_9FLAO|nr:hypothetical protein [Chryseobacterium profundimaris]SMP17421.1 hypothetical protein SAMN06264346_104129 [Chryseobacterium profundimaris]
MKNFFLFALILTSHLLFAQADIYFGKKPIVSAEIILENGDIKTGFLQDFKIGRFSTSDLQSMTSIEKRLAFEVKDLKFKEESNSAIQTINIADVKRIVILNKNSTERLVYDKMKLKTINSKNEVVDLNKTVILPLEQEGKLSLYGITLIAFGQQSPYSRGPATRYLTTLFIPYLKHSDSEYAYLPFDINRMNLFNLGKLEGKFKKALEESTKECPQFQENIDEIMKVFEKRLTKDQKQMYYDKEEKKKEIRKNTKDKAEEDFLQMKIDAEYGMQPYLNLVDDYNRKCLK